MRSTFTNCINAQSVLILAISLSCLACKTVSRTTTKGRELSKTTRVVPEACDFADRPKVTLEDKNILHIEVLRSGTEVTETTTVYQKTEEVVHERPAFEVVPLALLSPARLLMGDSVDEIKKDNESMPSKIKSTNKKELAGQTVTDKSRDSKSVVDRPLPDAELEVNLEHIGVVKVKSDAQGSAKVDLEPYLRKLVKDLPWQITVRLIGQPSVKPSVLNLNTSKLGVTWEKPLD